LKKEWDMSNHWGGISFGTVDYTNHESHYHFSVPVFLNGIAMNDLMIELYAEGMPGALPVKLLMSYETVPDNAQAFIFHADIDTTRPASDYTVRVVPFNHQIAVPLENSLIKWAH
jgi:glycogen phosphorylase